MKRFFKSEATVSISSLLTGCGAVSLFMGLPAMPFVIIGLIGLSIAILS
jgi:hypothetical protein